LFETSFFVHVSVCLNVISIYLFPLRAIPSLSFFFRFYDFKFLSFLVFFSSPATQSPSYYLLIFPVSSAYFHVFKYDFICFFPSFLLCSQNYCARLQRAILQNDTGRLCLL
jgi:hypothetical protein